ncbi:hypothetical protein B0O80DRAFT_436318 [Mortierella sp. GBAus27b]|nr:hypothetical protein B0O80DRAFT_436318 [Mortierella sp. GBAus27b]
MNSLTSLKRSHPRKKFTSSSSDLLKFARPSFLALVLAPLSLATSIPTSKGSRTSSLHLDRLPTFSTRL